MVKPFGYAIALTGSIATGKSMVAMIFKAWGFDIIDADSIAHTILDTQRDTIAKMFGADLVQQDKIDRKALGAIVFTDTKKRKQLEALLHPLIYKHIEHLAIELDKKKEPYLVDIPLFFENKSYPIKRVIVVYTPKAIQLERLIQRDNSSQIDAQKRIDTQISIEEKRTYATYLIDNSSTVEALEKACVSVKEAIEKGTIK